MAIGDKKSAVMQSDIVNDFTTGGAENVLSAEMGKTLAQRPNPNLLDNWYFVDPVDQRSGWVIPPGKTYYITGSEVGGTTDKYYAATLIVESADYSYWAITVDGATRYVNYSDAVRGYTGVGYTIDRWQSLSSTLTVLSQGDGMRFLGNGFVLQKLEQDFSGKTLTVSVLLNNGKLCIGTGVMPQEGAPNNDVFYETGVFTLFLEHASGAVNALGFAIPENSDLHILAAKLELGTQQTLAHQDDNGNWALNEIPDYGEQLARCQRYCLVIGHDNVYCPVGTGQARTTSNYQLHIPLPVSLRTFPTITKIGKVWVRNQEGIISLTSLNFRHNLSPNGISLECSGESDFIPGTFYESFTIPDGKLVISADL